MPAKAVLVTGASKGIGRAVARQMAATGLTIIAVARNKKELESLQKEIKNDGGNCYWRQTDLTDQHQIDQLVDDISSRDLRIASLIHCAGVAYVGPFESFRIDNWRDTLEINLTAPFLLTQKCLTLLDKSAHIFFLNSVAGQQTFSEWSAYCVSKHGLRALADTIRQEQAGKGIKVTTVYSASVDTPMQDKLPYNWDRTKMLTADDVARAIVTCFQQKEHVQIKEIAIENIAGTF